MTAKRPIIPEDLYQMKWINDPVVSPAGGSIAYVLKTVSDDRNGYRSHIRLLSPDGSSDVPFTSGDQDGSPAWSPDGSRLAFVRNRDDKRQVWIMQADGGEARPVTSLQHGVNAWKWSPDGKYFLVLSEVPESRNGKTELDHTGKDSGTNETTKHPEEARFSRIKYKADGAGLWNGRRSHLFLVNTESQECRQVTDGDYDVASFAWSPDGTRFAYIAKLPTEACPDPDLRQTNDVYVSDFTGISACKTDGSLSIEQVVFTPDGNHLLLFADSLSWGFASLTKMHLLPLNGGDSRVLFADLDIQLGHSCISDMRAGAGSPPKFSADGASVYVQYSDHGSVHIGRFALDGSSHQEMVGGEREIYQFDLTSEENIVFAAADPLQPGDLFAYRAAGGDERRLTDCNQELWSGLELSRPETFTYQASDGCPIQGWIMKPIGFKDGAKVPAVLEIHGGPHAMYGHTFMHEFQLLAAAGYAVFYTNPRGGHGYGQVHVNAVRGDYGGRDYQDLMEAVDYVLQAYPYIDESRLGVTGGSYGGFMTNWIVGHTNRFQAAVTQRSICNWISFYGVSDIGYYFTMDQIGGSPWDDLEKLWKHSPIAYVKNVKTPLLILHGEQDLRCPIEQGEQLFTALKRLGQETELVRFPGADHNLSRSGNPYLRVRRLEHIVRWFLEHIETK